MKTTMLIFLAVAAALLIAISLILRQWSKMMKEWEDNLKEEETKDVKL